jgi:3-hydroxyisobutyrate dehydrogenase
VLNASSGRSAASSDKYARAHGRLRLRLRQHPHGKDLDLYLAAAGSRGSEPAIGDVTAEIWRRFAAAEPSVDFTRIYPFVEGS